MEFKIIETELFDHCIKNEEGDFLTSGVSVLVTIEIAGKNYVLDFQTSTTQDYGAISTTLYPYDMTDEYDEIAAMFDNGSQDDGFFELLDNIKSKSDAQKKWNEYIDENYIRNDEHFGGMDAKSERDDMKSRD